MKIIAVLGDFYHEEDVFSNALSEAVATIEDVDLIYARRQTIIEKLKEDPDLVILASENRLDPEEDEKEKWMSPAAEERITEYVRGGGNWFAWHSGLAGYEENDAFVSMLGGYFTKHPDTHVNVQYRYKDDHELSQRKKQFELKDDITLSKGSRQVLVFLNRHQNMGPSMLDGQEDTVRAKSAATSCRTIRKG